MKKILPFCLAAFIVVACSKDKFQTKPQIRVVSQSGDFIPVASGMRITLAFTDKEGDLAMDSGLLMIKQRINKRKVSQTLNDTIPFTLPKFPANSEGEINLNLDYNFHLASAATPPNLPSSPTGKESDSLVLKFVARDLAGNRSDTATTFVVIQRQ